MSVSITPISGHYNIEWKDTSLGQTEQGFELRIVGAWEDVTCDAGGDSILTQIWRGGNVFVDFIALEKSVIENADIFYPVNTLDANGYPNNLTNKVGTNVYASAGKLELIPVGGNRARYYTFNKAILVSDISLSLSSYFTRIPITFQVFPDTSSSDNSFSTATPT